MGPKKEKKLPQAPLHTEKKVKKSTQFEKTPRNFRIGGAIRPQPKNLARFTKWPFYIRLQRQKRIMLQRLKVPPTLAQFQHTLDKPQFTQLSRLLKKLTPETRKQKKERLRAAASGKTDDKAPPTIKFGINHVTDLIESKKAKMVLIAHDVDPVEIICWMPALCRKMNVPYAIVKSKSRLGAFVHKKTASCLAITSVKREDEKDLSSLCESYMSNFNENKAVNRSWGGGVRGVKSEHVIRYRQALIEKEQAKKTGLML